MRGKNTKFFLKAIVAIAIALAFVMPGSAAVANIGTIGTTADLGYTNSEEDNIYDSLDYINIEAEEKGIDVGTTVDAAGYSDIVYRKEDITIGTIIDIVEDIEESNTNTLDEILRLCLQWNLL
jgi:hypothetical protein